MEKRRPNQTLSKHTCTCVSKRHWGAETEKTPLIQRVIVDHIAYRVRGSWKTQG